MTKPDFIIIGAAKSGTTTLYEYLCRHPQIFMSTPKEPDFFSLDQNYTKGIEWYESLFEEAKPHQICGEASTTYSRSHQHPNTAERIAKHLPDVKLIYIMRHPIDSAYSFYAYRLRRSQYNREFLAARNELMEAKTFEEGIAQQSEFIDSSHYLEQIEKYLPFYPQESFLFLFMEDLISNPMGVVTKIFDFLGVDFDIKLMNKEAIVANKADDDSEKFFRRRLSKSIQAIPLAKSASQLLPKSLKQTFYQIGYNFGNGKWTNQEYVPPQMLPETRTMLIEKFREPNHRSSQFLSRDLSHWNQ
ncbi:sulfotransferase domain-containing protein [Crocosphaera watsonii]|uniref:sulfotransferase domain-containing protein n=1 Tax=Crocosphaera watsonii TaxID=263511 RepID=UPI0006516E08|nr:sulfotransferase domain-containing protein [Crocosphaera watsonii]